MSGKRIALVAALLAVLGVGFFFSFNTGETMPEVSFTNLKGERIASRDLRGKIVMVNFWATSCATCVKEMPQMVETYRKYHAQGLEFIAVAMQYDPPNYVLNYVETRQLPFQVSLDVQGQLAQAFGNVRMTPTTFVIDKQGKVLKRYLGEPDRAELHALLESALKS